jgi:hypothetical protein
MKKLLLLSVIFLSACSTVVPVQQKFPELPEQLTQTCKPLKTIEGTITTLSNLLFMSSNIAPGMNLHTH